jgi:epoxyqueuosine reductase
MHDGPYTHADTEWIVTRAKALGFDLCGVAPAEGLVDAAQWNQWLDRGYAGRMQYLHDPRRTDPMRVLPDAKSVIVCAINYNTSQPISTEAAATNAASHDQPRGWISRYAWGDDYHSAVSEKLERLATELREHFGDGCAARAYADTGPIPERAAARNAGLGWIAKNTCLIHEDLGSFLFLGVVITSLPLAALQGPGHAPADLCGSCRLCLDACPTGALVSEYVMDARRCISYLTIELRESIPEEFRSAMGWQVFGCDICQDVCPWNRRAPVTPAAGFQPREGLVAPELAWLLSIPEKDFRVVFGQSAVLRTKWRGLMRNSCIAAGNAAAHLRPGSPESALLRERITPLAACGDPVLAEHASWALERLAGVAE